MGGEAKGTFINGCWQVRASINGKRPLIKLKEGGRFLTDYEKDRARAEVLAPLVSRMVRTGEAVDATSGETVSEYATRWLAYREERGVSSVSDDRSRLRLHVLTEIGSRPVAEVTKVELKKLVEVLDRRVRAEEIGWKTAQHAWRLTARMFQEAADSKRVDLVVRTDNPATGVVAPDRGVQKAKVYLWPSEFLTLIAKADVPVRWRRLFAIAATTGMRAGELKALTWDDVSLEHVTIHVHRSIDGRRSKKEKSVKNNKPRRVPIEPSLRPLLEKMHQESGAKR